MDRRAERARLIGMAARKKAKKEQGKKKAAAKPASGSAKDEGSKATKAEGAPVAFDDPVSAGVSRSVHTVYALGFRITKEMADDDQEAIMSAMPADLGDAARDHQERLAWIKGRTRKRKSSIQDVVRSLLKKRNVLHFTGMFSFGGEPAWWWWGGCTWESTSEV